MADTLQSSRNAQFTPCYCRTHKGQLIITDGINQSRIWDGVSSVTYKLGIDAPTAAITPNVAGVEGDPFVIYYRYLTSDGDYSSLSPAAYSASAPATYSAIGVSSDGRVAQVEVYRSASLDYTVLYLVLTVNNGTTTGADGGLDLDASLPVDNADGTENANRFDPPPTKRFVKACYDRYYHFGDVEYDIGHVEVTNGSASVQGRGTAWTSEMAARKMYFDGQTTEYTISSLNTSTQVITLSVVFGGSTNLFAAYCIRPDKLQNARLYYSSVAEPMSSRDFDFAIPVEEVVGYTGGFTLRGSLYACEAKRVWKLFPAAMTGRASANNKPGLGLSHASSRGLVNDRCAVLIDDIAYLLDREGVWVFDGNGEQPISQPIQDYFRDGLINFAAGEWFSAAVDPVAEIIRWHVSLGESYHPTHSLVYNYRRTQWHGVEEYRWSIGGSCLANMEGLLRPLHGSRFGKFYVAEGTLDGTTVRTIRGTATAATSLTVTDDSSDAVIPASPVGASLALVSGRGKGQVRRIAAYASGVMTVDAPWYVVPDTTSVYQVGGVLWNFKTGIMQFASSQADTREKREVIVVGESTTEDASLDVRRYLDQSKTPANYVETPLPIDGVTLTKNEPDAYFPLKRKNANYTFTGRRHQQLSGYVHDRSDHARFIQMELRGVQGMDRIKVYEVILEGVVGE